MNDHYLIAQIELPGKGKIDFVAIFDGHGDGRVAKELLNIFPEALANHLDRLKNIHNPLPLTDAIYQTISSIDYKMYQGGNLNDGSTALLALWPHNDEYLYIANLGNSRAIVWSDHKIILETLPHIPVAEKERILANNGRIEDGLLNGELEISRGFGDFYEGLKLYNNVYVGGRKAPLSPEADVYRLNLTDFKNKIRIVLASDGLWNVMDGKQIMTFFDKEQQNSCDKIITKAINNGSTDDITVIFIEIPSNY